MKVHCIESFAWVDHPLAYCNMQSPPWKFTLYLCNCIAPCGEEYSTLNGVWNSAVYTKPTRSQLYKTPITYSATKISDRV